MVFDTSSPAFTSKLDSANVGPLVGCVTSLVEPYPSTGFGPPQAAAVRARTNNATVFIGRLLESAAGFGPEDKEGRYRLHVSPATRRRCGSRRAGSAASAGCCRPRSR